MHWEREWRGTLPCEFILLSGYDQKRPKQGSLFSATLIICFEVRSKENRLPPSSQLKSNKNSLHILNIEGRVSAKKSFSFIEGQMSNIARPLHPPLVSSSITQLSQSLWVVLSSCLVWQCHSNVQLCRGRVQTHSLEAAVQSHSSSFTQQIVTSCLLVLFLTLMAPASSRRAVLSAG